MEINKQISASITLKEKLLADEGLATQLRDSVLAMVNAFKGGRKVLFCGNGGSAADAQHLAAELSGCFYLDRAPLNAEALHVNTSFLTATANDHSYEVVFKRMVEALGKPGDVLVALSTSGVSSNIICALQAAKNIGMVTVGLTGCGGWKMDEWCDILIKVPSGDTPRIQEAHMLLGHIICENVERMLFK